MVIKLEDIDVFVFDFDGVLTNNIVHLDGKGGEWVSCSRSDGLAFDAIKKLNKSVYILSTEKNPVVSARAKKLKIPVLQGVKDKSQCLRELSNQENFSLQRVLYVGNDLNDFYAMKLCGFSICPFDSHSKIHEISNITLKTAGGNGVVREILEEIIGLDLLEILYNH
jgi:3-deoxy-D-manno-octulosonate 8-phosphate phosphatase (KDO 8-P phosphatase)